jgi:predicted Zn-dependent peptidase
LEQDLWEEVDRLKATRVGEAELEKSKKKLRSSYLASLQTHFYKGIIAGVFEIRAGDHRWINRVEPSYQAVTAQDVLDAAQHYLDENNRTVVRLIPVSPQESRRWGDYE